MWISLVLTPILGLVLAFTLREILKYINCLRYSRQGVKIRYRPIIGTGLFFVPSKTDAGLDLTTAKKYLEDCGDEDLLVGPGGQGANSAVFLISPQAIKEFTSKEMRVSIKDDPIGVKFSGFILQNGEKALKFRSIFSKLFHYKNVNTLAPLITKIVDNHLNKLKKKISENKNKKILINLKNDLIFEIMEDVTSLFLFGEENAENSPRDENNVSLLNHVKEEFGMWLNLLFNGMANELFFGIPRMLGFASTKKILSINKKVHHMILTEFKKRKKMPSKKFPNYFDLVLEHNKQMEAEGKIEDILLEDDVINNFQLFQFAASDTTTQTSTSFIMNLIQNSQSQKKLAKELQKMPKDASKVDSDLLDSFEYLKAGFKETLRTSVPVPSLNPRKLIKDTIITGKKLFKGDFVLIAPLALHHKSSNFDNAMSFDPDRFLQNDSSKIKKLSYVPFGCGARICIGQYFGEMMVKCIVSRLVQKFEVEVLEGKKYDRMMAPIYGYVDPQVRISIREADE